MDAVEKLSNKRNLTRRGFLDIHIYIKNFVDKRRERKIIFACLQIVKKGKKTIMCFSGSVYVWLSACMNELRGWVEIK